MLIGTTLVLGLCLLASSFVSSERIRYDNYQVYSVRPTDKNQLDALREIKGNTDSLQFLQTPKQTHEKVTCVVAPHKADDFVESLKLKKISHELIEKNFQSVLDKENTKNKSNKKTKKLTKKQLNLKDAVYQQKFNWTEYQSYEDTNSWLLNLTVLFPSVVQPVDVGVSYERRRILGIKISSDKFKTNKPGIFLEGGMHAREWISPATVTYIVNQLLTSEDPQIKALFQKYNWYVVPRVNPDGYVYSQTTDRLWRKTRSPQANNCYGADPNRNWDIHFGESGVSADPCDEEFPGLKPFSEIETKSLSNYLTSLKGKIHLYLAFHSYAQTLLLPWGYTGTLPHNDKDLKKVMNVTIDAIGKRYGTKYIGGNIYTVYYPSSGSSMEWAYRNFGETMTFEFELRPDYDSPYNFVLPPDQIIPTAQETLDGIIAMTKEVDRLGYFKL